MSVGLTLSEALVAGLCERSFLTLWTHPNPVGKNGKELCDCLMVCGDDIVIFSVKDIVIFSVKDIACRDTSNAVGWDRSLTIGLSDQSSSLLSEARLMRLTTVCL